MRHYPVQYMPLLALALLALAAAAAPASEDALSRIADLRPVAGWSVLPDSTAYGSGDGLAGIYNGGYEEYTRAGVVDALRRIYRNGEEYVEVTVHAMQSARSAREFLADRYRMEKGAPAPDDPGWARFTASGAGSTTAYAVGGVYYITVVSYHDGERGEAQTGPFVRALSANAAKLAGRPE